jgi:hypothetical protein
VVPNDFGLRNEEVDAMGGSVDLFLILILLSAVKSAKCFWRVTINIITFTFPCYVCLSLKFCMFGFAE